MIFVTVGTERFGFNRLLEILDRAAVKELRGMEIFAQSGSCEYVPRHYFTQSYLEFPEMVGHIQKADIVLSHAGIGSTINALGMGKIPILFPRKALLGEHLDDHQMDFAKKIETLGKVIVAWDEKDLVYKILHYQELIAQLVPATVNLDKRNLISYLRQVIQ